VPRRGDPQNRIGQVYPGILYPAPAHLHPEVLSQGALLTVTRGSTLPGIDFRLTRGGGIAGSVLAGGRGPGCSNTYDWYSCSVELLDGQNSVVFSQQFYGSPYDTGQVISPGSYFVGVRTRLGVAPRRRARDTRRVWNCPHDCP
jgi:hypothetical protein